MKRILLISLIVIAAYGAIGKVTIDTVEAITDRHVERIEEATK